MLEALKHHDTAAEVWRDITRERSDPQRLADADAIVWVRLVAAKITDTVLDAEFKTSNRRAEAAQRAVGLVGRPDSNRSLRLDYERIEKAYAAASTRLTRREAVRILRKEGHDFGGKDDKNAAKVIDRLRQRPKKSG